ncbi:MAG: hypothetical protein NUW37_08015 [Planctomycetes bacterium]|nr:hypothetical protein [Planctomycetota bacterium]
MTMFFLADDFDCIPQVIGVIVFIVVGILSAVGKKNKAMQEREARRARRPNAEKRTDYATQGSNAAKKNASLQDILSDVMGARSDYRGPAKQTTVVKKAAVQPEYEDDYEDEDDGWEDFQKSKSLGVQKASVTTDYKFADSHDPSMPIGYNPPPTSQSSYKSAGEGFGHYDLKAAPTPREKQKFVLKGSELAKALLYKEIFGPPKGLE